MARDPKRIEDVLNRIRRIWHIYPDLRLGQLLMNVVGPDQDLFYVEDEALVAMTEDYQKQLSGRV
jgi:uncharacterized protein YihD (DUF1040 family)